MVRISGVLDVLLAAYAGLAFPAAWKLTILSWRLFGGIIDLPMRLETDTFAAVTGLVLFLWSTFHIMLPVPALLASVGLRWRSRWGRELGLALGGILLLLLPFGTLLGMLMLATLLDPRVAAHFAAPTEAPA